MSMLIFRRRVILGLTLAILFLVVAVQPFFLGHETYFGVDARIICCPIAFIVLPFLGIHLYINRHILKSLINVGSKKPIKLAVVIAMLIVGILDISSGWRTAISGQSQYFIMPMWAWSWLFTILIVIHVWLHRRAFIAYILRKKTGT